MATEQSGPGRRPGRWYGDTKGLDAIVEDADLDSQRHSARLLELWKEIRYGATPAELRRSVFTTGPDAIDFGLARALEVVVVGGSCRVRDLAEQLGIDPSTASRTIQRLHTMGLVTRRAVERDGRSVLVEATPDGVARWDSLSVRGEAAWADILSGFTVEEQAHLADLLERLLEGVEKALERQRRSEDL